MRLMEVLLTVRNRLEAEISQCFFHQMLAQSLLHVEDSNLFMWKKGQQRDQRTKMIHREDYSITTRFFCFACEHGNNKILHDKSFKRFSLSRHSPAKGANNKLSMLMRSLSWILAKTRKHWSFKLEFLAFTRRKSERFSKRIFKAPFFLSHQCNSLGWEFPKFPSHSFIIFAIYLCCFYQYRTSFYK